MSFYVDLSPELTSFIKTLREHPEVHIRQRFEMAELIGFETRNKYGIETPNGQAIGFAAEQGKGFFGHLARFFLGHWRTFEVYIFDSTRQVILRARHPFRFYFRRLEVMTPDGRLIGVLQKRFSIFRKRFDVEDAQGSVFLQMSSPFWKIWTFPFRTPRGDEVARIEKRWAGILNEAFTDKDRFRVMIHPDLEEGLVPLVLASGIFVDMLFFERKANG